MFEKIEKRPEDKRKRVRKNDPEDIEGFMGPWGGFVNEVKVAKPSEVSGRAMRENAIMILARVWIYHL